MREGSEDHFRATFERAPVGMAHLSADGRWLRVNDKLCEIVGHPREELVGRPFREITHPADVEKDGEQLRRLLAGEIGVYSTEKRCLTKAGLAVWTRSTISLARGPSGGPSYLIAVVEDVTGRRRTLERLRLRERAVSESTNSIVITDPNQPDDPVVYVNPAFEKTTGYTAEEAIGRNCRFLQNQDRDQPAIEELGAAVREGRHCTVVLRNYRKDGTLFYNELSIYPVRDEDGRVANFVGVQNDVTEQKRADRALSEIRRAERRRIARDLHDIVLQDLSGALQSLRLVHLRSRDSETGPDLSEEIEALGRASSGLRSAVYDLRHEEARPFVESVESLVELNRQATPGRRIRLVVGEGFPKGLSGRVGVELLRVLQEALTNARRHSGARNVEVALRAEGGEVIVEVTDDGRGFDPASAGGGVGLSAMRERIEGLSGEIRIDGRPQGGGTRVLLRAPRGDDTRAPPRR